MALNQTVSSTSEDDKSVALGTLKRSHTFGGSVSSLKHTDKEGIFYRLSGRAIRDERKKSSKLEEKNYKLEKENIDLKEQLRIEKQKHQEQQRELHAIMTDCSNTQLGDGNTMQIFEYGPDTEDPIPLIRNLMRIMQDANDQFLHRLTESENKLSNANVYLQKIHSIVLQLRKNGSSNDDPNIMDQLKEMVDLPTLSTGNDDFSSIEEAFKNLKVEKYMTALEHLKPPARRGIRLLVYKFGSMTKLAFANALSVGQWFLKQQGGHEQTLDDNSCSSITLHWLSTHHNDVPRLITILRGIYSQKIKESMQNLKQETFAKVYDVSGKGASDQSEASPKIMYQRALMYGNSVSSLISNRSDVSETLEKIERHVSETLQKTEDIPPDTNALLCALYSLAMDNTKTLQAVSDKVGASDVSVDGDFREQKPSLNDMKRNKGDQNGAKMKEKREEEYV